MKTILDKKNIRLIPAGKVRTVGAGLMVLLFGCMTMVHAQTQADKRLVLADQYFASGEYFTAAGLYGQFLNAAITRNTPSDFPMNSKRNTEGKTGTYKSKTDILFKQAESYRFSNYWKEAASLYKTCFEKDSIKYANALYWYAVCQKSMGEYAIAEESITRFIKEYGAGSAFQQSAVNERETLQFVKTQLSRPDLSMYRLEKVNSFSGNEKGIFAPAGFGGQLVVTSTQADSVETGMNPYHNRLFTTSFSNNSFQALEPVVIESADASLSQGTASMHANGNYLYFTQWKKENGQTVSAIYYAKKAGNGWGQPQLLTSVNEAGHNSKQPFCTTDGKWLYFSSDRANGQGNFDIWYAPLQADGTTGTPVNAGNINTTNNEQAPFFHNASSTLVFSSDRMPGMGGFDLFSVKGSPNNWSKLENMGYPVNSSRDDIYFFSSGENLLNNSLFSSDRGSECCLAIYSVSKTAKKRMISGVVRDCKDNEPVADAEVILKDALGRTMKVITSTDGKYSFEAIGDMSQQRLSVSKESYNDTSSVVTVENINESNWQTDTLYNAALCIEKKLVIKVENVVTVYFDFDQSDLKDRGTQQLDSIYNVLTETPSARIQISGYTDGLGSVDYNKKLSDKRAKACADYLIAKGIDASRISFESFGACCPVEMELINGRDNPDGRSMNRRALINIDK
jgi:outer membrane protein OmpA-like peptidoglycan-associated protein/tetratricopeptide (TPR) repeat protein